MKGAPDVIVHTALNTQYCQQEPESSFRANVLLPEWIAKERRRVGASRLLQLDRSGAAGVTQRGALEETLPPLLQRLRTAEAQAEARVLAAARMLALRLPWMYDLPGYHLPIRGNLPLNILKAAKTGEVLRFSRNDYRGVGYVREVSRTSSLRWSCPAASTFGSECDGDMVETTLMLRRITAGGCEDRGIDLTATSRWIPGSSGLTASSSPRRGAHFGCVSEVTDLDI